jgi:tetratricopeptide (TPR) repeat protein
MSLDTMRAVKRRDRQVHPTRKVPDQPAAPAPNGGILTPVVHSRKRLWIFRFSALVLAPLLLLGALELGLRMAGFGYDTSFFIPAQVQGEKVLIENRAFAFRFFPPAVARSASPIVMRAAKPPGSYRIFLFGESAALGDPRPAFGVGRYLEVLLGERFPGTNFEVICVAMTAINSHAILPIARECAKYQADLWVVYMGNNEFVGPFGASTIFGQQAPHWGLVRLNLALQSTRLGQGLVSLTRGLRLAKAPAKWTGMKMFLDQELAPTDPRKGRVYRNFAANLESILKAGTAAGVPIIVSSVASNLKDCPPFASLPPASLSPEKLAEWNTLYQAGVTNEGQGQFTEALAHYQGASRIEPHHPELQFCLGRCFLRQTNITEATPCFLMARDDDALPFRADSQINRLIAESASRHAQQGVSWLDAEKVMASASPNRLLGEDAFYEHVHLNFAGNFRLARAIAEPAAQSLRLPESKGSWADEATCARRLGLTDWNRQAVLEEIKARLSDLPFSNQLGHESRLERLDQQIGETQARARAASSEDLRGIYEAAIRRRPEDHWLHYNYAEYLGKVGELVRATHEMQEVRRRVPHNYWAYFQIGRLQARQKQFNEARQSLETALQLRPELPDIYLELGRLLATQENWEGALKYCDLAWKRGFDDGRLQVLKAKLLTRLKRREEATLTLREALRLDASLWEAHDLLGSELGLQGKFAEAEMEFQEVVRLRPAYAEGHLNLGIALARQRRFVEALESFREALRLDPQNHRAQEFLASIAKLQQQRE